MSLCFVSMIFFSQLHAVFSDPRTYVIRKFLRQRIEHTNAYCPISESHTLFLFDCYFSFLITLCFVIYTVFPEVICVPRFGLDCYVRDLHTLFRVKLFGW